MKKLVLSVFTFAIAINVNAQTCVSKFSPSVAYDDFSSATDPSNPDFSGMYTWGDPTLAGDTAVDKNPAFQAVLTRNATTGMLDAVVTQGRDGYVPYGISFGDSKGDKTGVPFYLDLTNDKTFSVTVTNNSTITDIKFRMTIQDAAGKEIDTYKAGLDAGWADGPYKNTIEMAVDKGQTATLSGTYDGGGKADYTTNSYVTGLDFTKVAGIYFTVINKAQDALDGYKHLGVTDVPVSIDVVRVGACPLSSINEAATYANSSLYPNPTSDVTNVTLDLNEVANVKIALTDMFGKQVKVVAEGRYSSINEKVNVSDLAKGVYTVNYMVNGAAVKNKLLLVK